MTNLKQIITYWDEEKTKIKEVYFVDEQGRKQGVCKGYDKNGNVELEKYYENGVEVKVKIK